MGKPMPLLSNKGKSFQGSIVLGKGFVLSTEKAKELIKKDPRNKDVIFPYLNGDDLNNDPEQKPSRWVINFFDWDEEKAKTYPDCYEIIEKLVKPERQRWKKDNEDNEIVGMYALRKPLPQKWWIYGEKRPALYNAISELDQVIVIPETTKFLTFSFCSTDIVFSHANKIICYNSFKIFAFLKSNFHLFWVWKNSSTLESRMKYITTDAFDTFPFPTDISHNLEGRLEDIGSKYYAYREKLTRDVQLGFTKIYNLFHSPGLDNNLHLSNKNIDFLIKHLENTNKNLSFETVLLAIKKLRQFQIEIDNSVLEAYKWQDIQLRHDFYEIDYLPKNDNIRFTIHPIARKEILKRLLLLNFQQYSELSEINNIHKSINKKNLKITPNILFPED